MAAVDVQTTHDLRADNIDYKRDKNHAAKWALGEAPYASGRRSPATKSHPVHPQQRVNAAIRRFHGADKARSAHKANVAQRHDVEREQDIDLSGPLDDAGSEIPVDKTPHTGDADIAYSFDAPRGPTQGSQILGIALTKAVERFETRETDNLIRTEYEVVTPCEEAPPNPISRDAGPPTDEDFELV